jgi:TonB family protein
MTRHDPVLEIRSSLDREAARRLDADRLAAGLRVMRSLPARSSDQHAAPVTGPFGRVPLPIQWIGIAAAVIAAITGLRSLYLDVRRLDAPLPRSARVASAAVPPPASEAPPFEIDGDREGDSVAAQSARRVAAVHRGPRPGTGTKLDPDASRVRRTVGGNVVDLSIVAPEPPAPEAQADPPSERVTAVVPPVDEPPQTPVSPLEEPAPPVAMVFDSATEAGGVRLESLAANGSELPALVHELPAIDATLVSVVRAPRLGGAQAVASDSGGARAGHPRAASTGKGTDESFLYVRLLAGGSFHTAVNEPRGVTGPGLRMVPLHELEPWGHEGHRDFLAEAFGLRTIAAESGALVDVDASGKADARLVVGVGDGFYAVSIQTERSSVEGERRVVVQVARKPPLYTGSGRGGGLEAKLHVQEGRIAVLCIPDRLLEPAASGSTGSNTLFVVLSPRFGSTAEDPARMPAYLRVHDAGEAGVEPPTLIAEVEPVYPPEAQILNATGTVTLRAVVREDGIIDGIQVVQVPDTRGSEYLVAAAVNAARDRVYLPARRHGQPVHAYVTIAFEFPAR